MKKTMRLVSVVLCTLPLTMFAQKASPGKAKLSDPAPAAAPVTTADARIIKEVRHEILSIPQYGVFDFLSFAVNGSTVTLVGDVRLPVTRINAENAVKQIEGVTKVENKINVLPVFSADNNIRIAVYQAIYGSANLQRYAFQAIPQFTLS